MIREDKLEQLKGNLWTYLSWCLLVPFWCVHFSFIQVRTVRGVKVKIKLFGFEAFWCLLDAQRSIMKLSVFGAFFVPFWYPLDCFLMPSLYFLWCLFRSFLVPYCCLLCINTDVQVLEELMSIVQ